MRICKLKTTNKQKWARMIGNGRNCLTAEAQKHGETKTAKTRTLKENENEGPESLTTEPKFGLPTRISRVYTNIEGSDTSQTIGPGRGRQNHQEEP
jgi:hypothetical protein